MIDFLYNWQTFFGALLGASAPFLLWIISNYYFNKSKYKENLIFLERVIVDQLNGIIETRRTIRKFIDGNLSKIISDIESSPSGTHAINRTFFPLFSNKPMPIEVLKISTKSGFINNKLDNAFGLLNDFPLTIEDSRKQFDSIRNRNNELFLSGKIDCDHLKDIYLTDLKSYRQVLEKEVLDINITSCVRVLIVCHDSLNSLMTIGIFKWHLKFNPKYKFYLKKKTYLVDKGNNGQKIDDFFSKEVELKLKKYLK